MKRWRALTLVEVLLAMGLFSLLMTLASQLMRSGLQHSLQEVSRTEHNYQLQTLVAFLRSDLIQSDPSGVWISLPTVAIVPIQTLSPQGKAVWSDHVNLYVWKDTVLTRYEVGKGNAALQLGTTAAPVLNPASVASLLQNLPRSSHRWSGLTEFALATQLTSNPLPVYSLHLAFQAPEVPGKRRESPILMDTLLP